MGIRLALHHKVDDYDRLVRLRRKSRACVLRRVPRATHCRPMLKTYLKRCPFIMRNTSRDRSRPSGYLKLIKKEQVVDQQSPQLADCPLLCAPNRYIERRSGPPSCRSKARLLPSQLWRVFISRIFGIWLARKPKRVPKCRVLPKPTCFVYVERRRASRQLSSSLLPVRRNARMHPLRFPAATRAIREMTA
jgi:hypothetical protein